MTRLIENYYLLKHLLSILMKLEIGLVDTVSIIFVLLRREMVGLFRL